MAKQKVNPFGRASARKWRIMWSINGQTTTVTLNLTQARDQWHMLMDDYRCEVVAIYSLETGERVASRQGTAAPEYVDVG